LLLFIAALVLCQGIFGPFVLDDYENLRTLERFQQLDGYSLINYLRDVPPGGSGRLVAFWSFWLQVGAWPDNPLVFKIFNFVCHLLTGVGVYFIALALFTQHWGGQGRYWALLLAFIWLIHPLHASSVFYVVQRMTLLSGFFVVLSACLYIYFVDKKNSKTCSFGLYACIGVLIFLAIFSKENGILACLFLILLKISLNKSTAGRLQYLLEIGVFYVPIALLVLYFVGNWDEILRVYDRRAFSLGERLLTQSVIVWGYALDIVIPNLGRGVFYEDYEISRGVTHSWETLFAVVAHGVLVSVALLNVKRLWAQGILWFYVGHLLESTFVPLELYFEHRNYVPSIGVLISLLCGMKYLAEKLTDKVGKKVIFAFLAAYTSLFVVVSSIQSRMWSDEAVLMAFWHQKSNASIRSVQYLNNYWIKNGRDDLVFQNYEKFLQDPRKARNLGFLGSYAMHVCQAGLDSKMDRAFVDRFIDIARDSESENSVHTYISMLINMLWEMDCGALTLKDMLPLLEGLVANPKFQYPTVLGNTWYHIGLVHAGLGNLNLGVKALDTASFYYRDPKIPIQQAAWLFTANLYEEALYYVFLAEAYENLKPFGKYRNLSGLNEFKKQIKEERQKHVSG
jgi:hypothetical protein